MVIVFMGMRQLGALVRARREESGLTQEQLAEQVGCGHSYVSKIELGHQKGLGHEMLRNLASVLGESQERLEAVLYDEPPPRPTMVDPEIAREVPIVAIGGASGLQLALNQAKVRVPLQG